MTQSYFNRFDILGVLEIIACRRKYENIASFYFYCIYTYLSLRPITLVHTQVCRKNYSVKQLKKERKEGGGKK